MINKESTANECPQYLKVENQEYVLLCVSNKEVHDKFLFRLKERLIESEDTDLVAYEILQFMEDIMQYLKGENNFRML